MNPFPRARPRRRPKERRRLNPLHLLVLRVRTVFLVALAAATVVVHAHAQWWLVALALGLIVLPYNLVLTSLGKRRGRVPGAMAVLDQVLCAGFLVVWPELAAAVFIAGMLDGGVAALMLSRRAAMAGAVTGSLLMGLPLLVLSLAHADTPFVYAIAGPAYVIGVLALTYAVGTVAAGERKARRQISGILDALPVAVYEMDATTWHVHYVSPAIEPLTGRPPEFFLGNPQRLLDTVHRRDVRMLLSLITDVSETRRSREIEYRVFDVDGRMRWVRNSASTELGPDGKAITVRGSIADITAQKSAEIALSTQARTDPLTGLPNRLSLLESLQNWAGSRQGLLVFLDLDGFKRINDSLGHRAGDQLLVEVAARLSRAVGERDVVARLGGDEFVVLAETDGDQEAFVSRLLAAFGPGFSLSGRAVHVTASAGAVPVDEPGAPYGEELLERADAAMYVAKRAGHGKFAFFDPEMRATAQARLDLESELRVALDRDEFRVLYQPIVRAADFAVTGYEALVRWEHSERGLVFPDQFIPVAVETGLIVPMGRFVIGEACRQLQRWAGAGVTDVAVNVNLSARQLRDPELVRFVREVLADTAVAPSALCLEITETALLHDPASALAALQGLRELGVLIALDDFGTGYSSLSHLHQFPVDLVKVDRSFVADVLDAASPDRGIVTAVLHLAAHMGFTVVAEGVEQLEQAEVLRELGCDFLQGYAFGRPAPAVSVPARGVSGIPPQRPRRAALPRPPAPQPRSPVPPSPHS